MLRCTRARNLEVHHISRTGGNGLGNARVLCQECHEKTKSYGIPSESPPKFAHETRKLAFERAAYRCECTSNAGCH